MLGPQVVGDGDVEGGEGVVDLAQELRAPTRMDVTAGCRMAHARASRTIVVPERSACSRRSSMTRKFRSEK